MGRVGFIEILPLGVLTNQECEGLSEVMRFFQSIVDKMLIKYGGTKKRLDKFIQSSC